MRSNAGMVNRQRDVDLLFAQVSVPPTQLTLWLGLAAMYQSEGVLCQTHEEEAAIQYISKETTPDRPATMSRGPRHTTAQPSRQQQ